MIRKSILSCLICIGIVANAQNSVKQRTESTVLFLAFDHIIFDNPVPVDSIFASLPNIIQVYNSNSKIFLQINGYNLFYQRKLQDNYPLSIKGDKLDLKAFEYLRKMMPGDIFYFEALNVKIGEKVYSALFAFKFDKLKNQIRLVPSKVVTLTLSPTQ